MSVFLDADEREIVEFLKSMPGQYVSIREVCRRAGGKRKFMEDPNWAKMPLLRLIEKGVAESDTTGHFRLVSEEKKKKPKRWLSPQMKKILEESGKEFHETDDEGGTPSATSLAPAGEPDAG